MQRSRVPRPSPLWGTRKNVFVEANGLNRKWILSRLGQLGAVATMLLIDAHCAASASPDVYAYDPGFNAGYALPDHFNENGDMIGQKLARLSNGDIVVVGLVPKGGGGNSASGLYHIGLARHTATGGDGAWNEPNLVYTYGTIGGPYLTYPVASTAYFSRIDDVVVQHGVIYVMADCQCSYPNTQRDAQIIGFTEDGTFIGQYGAFATAFDEWGAGLVPYTYTLSGAIPVQKFELIAVATYYNPGASRSFITALQYNVDKSDGTLAVDTMFGPYHTGRNDYVAPDNFCAANTNCTVEGASVASLRATTSTPTVYVAASTQWSGANWDVALLQIDGSNGVGSFPGVYAFNAGGTLYDRAVSIAARTTGSESADEVYLAASVATDTGTGMGVAKFTHGAGWEYPIVIGGIARDFPYAIALAGDLVGVSGGASALPSSAFDPELAVLNAADCRVRDFRTLPVRDQNGTRVADSEYYGLMGAADGGFLAIGIMGNNLGGTSFATAQFSNDRVFAATFESH